VYNKFNLLAAVQSTQTPTSIWVLSIYTRKVLLNSYRWKVYIFTDFECIECIECIEWCIIEHHEE